MMDTDTAKEILFELAAIRLTLFFIVGIVFAIGCRIYAKK